MALQKTKPLIIAINPVDSNHPDVFSPA